MQKRRHPQSSASAIMELDARSGSGSGSGSGGDHKAPRSKHSATEHRRRSKINERCSADFRYFETLYRRVITRERATFLLESSNRVPGDFMPGAAPTTKNCSAGNFLDNSVPATPEMLQNSEMVVEPARLNADSIESQYQSQRQQLPCPADCPLNNEMGNEQEELTIDEGTITVSSMYSQNLFTALTNAMESSGVDLSQASVTVQINLARRPNNMSSAKE